MSFIRRIFLPVLTLSTPAFADTVCTDSTGSVEYRYQGYRGGIAPREGVVIARFQILVNGKQVSQSIVRQGREPELGPVNPDFSEVKVTREALQPCGSDRDFTARLTLSRNPSSQQELPGLTLPMSVEVSCRESVTCYP